MSAEPGAIPVENHKRWADAGDSGQRNMRPRGNTIRLTPNTPEVWCLFGVGF